MDNNPGILLQIKSAYNQLTKAEKKVADFVLENTEQVLYMSITDLADACSVGDTSVYRFCRTMKLQGYQEFKMQLSLSLAAQDVSGTAVVQTEAKDLAERIMLSNIQAIQDTYMLLDRESVSAVVTMMEEARRVYFFGIGDSRLSAEEGRNKFLRITGKVACISDPHLQSMAAAIASEEDLIIIISYSGATKDNIYVAKEAKRAGAKIACITHYRKSPLTAYADAVLLCGAKEAPMDGGSMAAKIGQMYLIDLLYQEYYSRNTEECAISHEKTVRSVVEKLY
ncbi:MAG: MurR/RpiR family transcriptional regulator [Clostridiales bacterium]|nr:MurR/RpiR family transcriptional regulator [Clostridiales bacterium]